MGAVAEFGYFEQKNVSGRRIFSQEFPRAGAPEPPLAIDRSSAAGSAPACNNIKISLCDYVAEESRRE
jgi:hypothetical protein